MSVFSDFCLLLFVILTTPAVDANPKLIHAEVLWRHGTRAPDHLYATSLNKATDFPPGLGELVPQGVLDHIKLGAKLGRRYINETGLVSPTYIAKEIKAISTTSDRTIASAQANFAGFYGFKTALVTPTFTPVPIWPMNVAWMNWTYCRPQREYMQVVLNSDEYAKFHAEFAPLRKTLSENSGTDVTENDHVASGICDAIKFELLNRKPIATWAALIQPQCDQFRKRYYEFILGFVHFNYNNVDMRNTTRKMFSGVLFEVLGRLYPYANRDPSSYDTFKYYASSIHDIHLSLLSLTLGFDFLSFTEDRWIGLAEAISFELWYDDSTNARTVKVWFYQNNKDDPIELTKLLPGCKNTATCLFWDLYGQLDYFKIDNFEKFCTESLNEFMGVDKKKTAKLT